jgi:hypothetical protein
LRLHEPDLVRPFRIPGGTIVAALLSLFPTALFALAFYRNRTETIGTFSALTLALLLMAAGPVIYLIARRRSAFVAEATN